jgi:serine/threonine protein kinase
MATPLSSALHLCKRIREEYSHISLGHLTINGHQSMLLFNKVVETENTLKPIQVKLSQQDTTSSGFPNVGPATEELVHVLRAAHTTIFKDCFCKGKWMESALRQGGDFEETFAEILYDLQWHMQLLRSIFQKWTLQDSSTPPSWLLQQVDHDGNLSERDNDSLLRAAKQDQEDLKVRLGNLKGDHACHGEGCSGTDINQQCLASQLLNKMEFQEQFQAWPTLAKKNYHEELYKVDGIKLSKWPSVVLANPQDLRKGVLLGEGAVGCVYEAKWLGESYAMKIPKYPSRELLKQDIATLASVHHPHIVRLVCCVEDAKNSVYVMERMHKSLSQMLRDGSKDSQPSLIGRVGVMLQIAEGMKYLHCKDLVHRDLKTDNILIKCDRRGSESSMLDLVVKPLWIAKISDFGTAKLKMDSTAYANQTTNIGTTMFMAPEMYKVERVDQEPERFHPKKTDVYSFGHICFAVLTGEPTPFSTDALLNPSAEEFKERVLRGMRPQLPPDCPSDLSSLIQQCWDGDPDKRPNFQEICTKLRHIKGLLLTGMAGRAYSGEDTLALLDGVPGVRTTLRTTLRGQEDSLRSRVSPRSRSRSRADDNWGLFLLCILLPSLLLMIPVILISRMKPPSPSPSPTGGN